MKRGVIRVHRRSAIVVMLGLVFLSCLALYSLTLGDYGLGVADSLRRLTGDGGPSEDYLGVYFVQSVRLPRVVCAVAVGASLAIAGRIFQTISGNPLGSPDVVGLSAGSATGALVAIIILGASPAATGTGALIGGLVSGALVLACSGGTRVTGIRVVLVGIGCSAALRALNSLLVVKAPLEAAQRAQLWSAGSLNGVTFVRAFPLIVGLGVLGLSCACAATSIGLLAMGDDVATGLGVRVRVVRVSAIVSAIVLVVLATAVAGPVAFVALSAPHIAARLCGGGGVGVVSSAVVGAALVLSADVVAQRIVAPAELPVGVVTGVLGGLYLLWILTREEAR
ncbi:MAG: FecCD family ABC transporter permease [Pauljensenia sp.]